jgi:hypothetical protein
VDDQECLETIVVGSAVDIGINIILNIFCNRLACWFGDQESFLNLL